MEPIAPSWQELRARSGPKCPKLFYSFSANEEGYSLHLTDLIGFWAAGSPVVDIVDYAKITRTSIDPSVSKSQFRMLLQKMAQSLAEGVNTLRQEEGQAEVILLQTVLQLPRPLQPLKWEFYLEPKGSEELAEHLLRPCLFGASDSKRKLESLYEIIKAKDHVISKLMDKIEGASIDLSIVFPGIVGAKSRKGQTTVRDAQKHVPGLRPFNKDDWEIYFRSDNPYAGYEAAGLSNLVAGCQKCPKHKSHQHEQWLRKLPKASSSASQVARELMDAAKGASEEDSTASDSGSDNLETQAYRKDQRVGNPPTTAVRTVSALGSSSPLLPPPLDGSPLSNCPDFSLPTGLSTQEGNPKRHPLGTIGLASKYGNQRRRDSSQIQTSSSPPPPLPRLSSTSPFTSSPPPLPDPGATDARTKSPSSIATLSSLNPVTPPKRRLGRLGSFKDASASASATPEQKRAHQDKELDQLASSNSGTPSHRLRRIGMIPSRLTVEKSLRSSFHNDGDDKGHDQSKHNSPMNDNDTPTASSSSTTSSPSPSHAPKPANPTSDSASALRTRDQAPGALSQSQPSNSAPGFASIPSTIPYLLLHSEAATADPDPEPNKAEKAAQRRQELKRKYGTSSSRSATNTNAAPRKKRKF